MQETVLTWHHSLQYRQDLGDQEANTTKYYSASLNVWQRRDQMQKVHSRQVHCQRADGNNDTVQLTAPKSSHCICNF